MSAQDYKRLIRKFINGGVNVSDPVDLLRPGKFPRLVNVRAYPNSPLIARSGLTAEGATEHTGQALVHSLRRLNDDSSGSSTWTLIRGAGTVLYYGQTAPTSADTGYSGDPLALIPYRPDQSPQPWIYVGDRSRMRKINSAGTVRQIGFVPPTAVPVVSLNGAMAQKVINEGDTAADWTQGGTAGAPALLTGATGRINSGAVTITQILYDSGTTGWCCIQPSLASAIGPGLRLIINTGGGAEEVVNVQEVHPGTGANTTIGGITYDSGTTGACTIQLTVTPDFLARNSFIRDTTVGENVRVISVTGGPDGTKSFRCSTVGTFAAGDTISVLPSFRAYTANNHAAAETLRADAIRTAVTAGTGYVTDTIALDLSLISTRPVQPDDWLHFSVRFDFPNLVTEFRIGFDVDAATNDFTRNFYFKAFRPSDLTPAIRVSQPFTTARTTAVSRQLIDEFGAAPILDADGNPVAGGDPTTTIPNASSEQIGTTGDTQWYEVWFKVSNLTRVGADESRTLANVAAVRLTFTVTGAVNCDFDAIWIGGTYGPDTYKSPLGYLYRYRGRDSTTGAKGNWSPPTRSEDYPNRQSVTVSVTGLATATWPGCDKLDIQRFGGNLPQWTYVGTVTNDSAGGAVSFTDNFSDAMIAGGFTGEDDNFQPWPVIDLPDSGVCNVVGTTVSRVSGDTFATNWAPGTVININGINYPIYGNPASTALLHLVTSAGTQTNSTWYIAEPVLQGASLPSLWGPVDGMLYACGDIRNQGTLYFTKGNHEETSERYKVEITSPSEPLMNGEAFDGTSYVFSSERLFRIFPDASGPNLVRWSEVPNGKGLFARWALCVGPSIWFLSKDGIYETQGGEPRSITFEDLNPIFPHDGIAGVETNGFKPPLMDSSNSTNLRLSFYDGMLYFDYVATDSSRNTLVYNVANRTWTRDDYARDVAMHYGQEGSSVHGLLVGGSNEAGTDGMVYNANGTSDDGDAIACQIRTPSLDEGDPDILKLWGDVLLDLDRDGATLTIVQGFDQYGTTLASQSISTLSGRQRYELATNSNAGQEAYNAALDITWSSATAVPKLYGWENAFLAYPRALLALQTIETTHGLQGFQHLRMFSYIALISSADVTFRIVVDGTVHSFTILSTSGAYQKVLVPLDVMKGKSFAYRLSSTAVFRFFQHDSEVVAVKSWGSTGPYLVVNPFGVGGEPE